MALSKAKSGGLRAPALHCARSACAVRMRGPSPPSLQRAPACLLALDGFEEGLEVAFSEGLGALALDDFDEDGGAVHQRLGEQLKEVALVVAVD